MDKKLSGIIIILVLIVVVVEGYFLFQTYRNPAKKYTGPMEKITLGVEKSLFPSLVWVAENKGYFEENGVEVTIKDFDSGRLALKTMLKQGGLDMVTAAQTPVVSDSFEHSDFVIVAAMVSSYNYVKVSARRDRGITRPVDLRGKNIGLTKGSSGQYFLGMFLVNNGIQLSEVNVQDIKTSELVASLQNGTVDAISTWEPQVSNAQSALGDNGVTFPAGKILLANSYFLSNQNFLQANPIVITRFLQALTQAEDFIKENKDEAITIVSERLGWKRDVVSSVWDEYQFGLFLDQTIIQSLEEQAKWAIQNKLTDKTVVPNYLDFISVDALKKAAPEKAIIVK